LIENGGAALIVVILYAGKAEFENKGKKTGTTNGDYNR
jgi:hypothetical protein